MPAEGFQVQPPQQMGFSLAQLPSVVGQLHPMTMPGSILADAMIQGVKAGESIGASIANMVYGITPEAQRRRELEEKKLALAGREMGVQEKKLALEERMMPLTEKRAETEAKRIEQESESMEQFQKNLKDHPEWYTIGADGHYIPTEEWIKVNKPTEYAQMQEALKSAKTANEAARIKQEGLANFNATWRQGTGVGKMIPPQKPSAPEVKTESERGAESLGAMTRYFGKKAGVLTEVAPEIPSVEIAKKTEVPADWKRADGSKKGQGFLGQIKRPDGKVMTEFSVGVNLDGKETEIPTLVPDLTPDEIKQLSVLNTGEGDKIPDSIIEKAVDHAKARIAEGLSPFKSDEEDVVPVSAEATGDEAALIEPGTLADVSAMPVRGALASERTKEIQNLKVMDAELSQLRQRLGDAAQLGIQDEEGKLLYQEKLDDFKKTRDKLRKQGEDQLTPAERVSARMFAENRKRWTFYNERDPRKDLIMEYINQLNPRWSQEGYDVNRAKRMSYEGGGKGNQQIISLNTAVHHIGGALDQVGKLNNTSIKKLNDMFRIVGTELADDPRYNAFMARTSSISEELAKLLKGGVPSEEEVKNWQKIFSTGNGPKILEGALRETLDLMQGRLVALKDDYESALGPLDKKGVEKFLSKHSQEILSKHDFDLSRWGIGESKSKFKGEGKPPPQLTPDQKSALVKNPVEGTRAKMKDGKWWVFRNGQWTPE